MDNFKKYKSPPKNKKNNRKKKRVKIKKKKVFKLVSLLVIIVVVFTFGKVLRGAINIDNLETSAFWVENLDEIDEAKEEKAERVNTVVALVNSDDSLEYLIVINHHAEITEEKEKRESRVGGLLLPANTYIKEPGQNMSTLKSIYQGEEIVLLMDALRKNFELELHNMLKVDTSLLEDLGAEFLSAEEFNYEKLKFQRGKEKELVDRLSEKGNFITTCIEGYKEEANFWNRSEYLNNISQGVETNFTWSEAREFIDVLKTSLFTEDLHLIPGELKNEKQEDYWLVKEGEAYQLLGQLFYIDEFIQEELAPPDITVEVVGVKTLEAAERVGNKLEEKGFNVKDIRQEEELNYNSNVVISREEPEMAAKAVALEIDGADLLKDHDPDVSVMVSVIVGED